MRKAWIITIGAAALTIGAVAAITQVRGDPELGEADGPGGNCPRSIEVDGQTWQGVKTDNPGTGSSATFAANTVFCVKAANMNSGVIGLDPPWPGGSYSTGPNWDPPNADISNYVVYGTVNGTTTTTVVDETTTTVVDETTTTVVDETTTTLVDETTTTVVDETTTTLVDETTTTLVDETTTTLVDETTTTLVDETTTTEPEEAELLDLPTTTTEPAGPDPLDLPTVTTPEDPELNGVPGTVEPDGPTPLDVPVSPTPETPSAAPRLPVTGASLWQVAMLAVGMFAGGVGLRLLTRRV
jgi:hypothetical protein